MEVILLENIIKLGKIGDLVKVRNGYGRNFLHKQGKALRFNKENLDFVNKNKVSQKQEVKLSIINTLPRVILEFSSLLFVIIFIAINITSYSNFFMTLIYFGLGFI